MYAKLQEIIDAKLKSGDYKMTVKDSGFGCMPIFRFKFSDKPFHYIRVDFSTFVLKEKHIIKIEIPDEIKIRAGFRGKTVSSDAIYFETLEMKRIIEKHIRAKWEVYDTAKDGRVQIIINKLYSIWKSKHDS